MRPFDFQPRTRVVFREGGLSLIGELARSLGFTRTLIVADPRHRVGRTGRACGLRLSARPDRHVRISRLRRQSGCGDGRGGTPQARPKLGIDSIVALGGGSSLDCAKGINFVLTNGGTMKRLPRLRQGDQADAADDRRPDDGRHRQRRTVVRDHLGFGDAREDGVRRSRRGVSHCAARSVGSRSRNRAVVTAMAGYDAISHAVESFVTTRRTDISDLFARERMAAAARRTTSGCSTSPADLERARRDADRRARGRRGDRAVDARARRMPAPIR